MKLKEIFIENFRGIKDLHLKLDYPTTILIGENNTGKTTILEALKIVLDRKRIYKEKLFSEFDFHSEEGNNPLENEILIELWFKEEDEDEWNTEITTLLADIIQLNPITNLNSIGIRIRSVYDLESKISKENWYWLGLMDRNQVSEVNRNHKDFFKIIQYFYQNALRDSKSSFSQYSMFWNKFLKLNLDPTQIQDFTDELQDINDRILASDVKVGKLKTQLDNISEVVTNDIDNVAIQAFPEKVWDLSNKATLMIKTKGSSIELPLERFGQGTQSLSVLMLFKAYSEILMRENTDENAIAILGLEEPEVHLYPQAVRSLWTFLKKIGQQKVVSTHSTFFIQEADLTSLRLLKRKDNTVQSFSIQQTFEIRLPKHDDLIILCNANENLSYISFLPTDGGEEIGVLTVKGKLETAHYDELKRIYSGNTVNETEVDSLNERSKIFLTEDELFDLKYYTERIRGEIFFAKAWLLCEGQSEYLLLRYFAKLMGKDLDKNGVSIIDYQNNASPALFIVLAKHFDMPWLLFSDNDNEYNKVLRQISNKSISEGEITNFISVYPTSNTDFELYLYQNGFKDDYLKILLDRVEFINGNKTIALNNQNKLATQLIYKNDSASIIRVNICDNTVIEVTETDSQYQNLLNQTLNRNNIRITDLELAKQNTDFSNQNEIELFQSNIGNASYEVIYNRNTTQYYINIVSHGKTIAINEQDVDFSKILEYNIVKTIQSGVGKILSVQKLIRNLRKANATDAKVPQFFKDLINKITTRT
jgi:putative ATP-dependent endonuclease of OLD family